MHILWRYSLSNVPCVRVGYTYKRIEFLFADIKYDAEKEEKIKQEKKQQELTAIEEAIKYAEEAKNKSKNNFSFIVSEILSYLGFY